VRAALLLLALIACKHEARETTPMPSLDPVAADAGVVATPAPPVEQLALVFEELDGPPTSAPSGPVVQVKFVPPSVGATRKRTQLSQAIHRITIENKLRLQETLTAFVLREEVLAVAANRVKKLKITVEKADEVIVLEGKRNELPLLRGEYTVDVGGLYPENMKITAPGRTIGTREQEEVSVIVAMDAGSTTPFHELVWQHPLKVGEAVVLTPAEMKTLVGGDTPALAITFSLRNVKDGIATYQLDTQLDANGERRIVRQRYAVRVATGQLVEIMDATRSTEQLRPGAMTTESRRQLLVRFE
jgi:hypothetical protein